MPYKINNGKIQTSLCELNVVHHCNLSCRSCSHLSASVNAYFVDPDQVLKDFSILAESCQPGHIRLCGGEPLLHPDILDVIDAVRDSGISKCIRVVTNGTLLHRVPERFWQIVDQVHISLYPASRITPVKIDDFRRLAQKHRTEIEIRYIDRFRESFSALGTADLDLVKRIYATCQIAHTWRCQAIFEGSIYRCSPSIMISRLMQDQTDTTLKSDGLKLALGSTFAHDLKKFLTAKQPLNACRYCIGTVGKRFAHMQAAQQDSIAQCAAEELVDWKYLRYYELTGNRQVPSLLRSIGAPAKKALSAIRNLAR